MKKIIEKIGFITLILIALIIILSIICIIGFLVFDKVSTKMHWMQIKSDFKKVNELVIDYYDKNCETKCDNQDNMYFYIDYAYDKESEIQLHIIGKNVYEKSANIELNDDIKNRLIRIEHYYDKEVSGFSDRIYYIKVTKQTIEYESEVHPPKVIYYRKNKPTSKERNDNNLEHLSGKWYKTKYESHL